jgi:hypothetical protein
MNIKVDIFKRLPDGHPLWMAAVDGLEEARAYLARLTAISPGEYFIYSNGQIIQAKIASQQR